MRPQIRGASPYRLLKPETVVGRSGGEEGKGESVASNHECLMQGQSSRSRP